MKTETICCDIKGCKSTTGVKIIKMQVIFTTEQTEGRSCKPYFEIIDLDLCEACLQKILKERVYIKAHGAMGYNEYSFPYKREGNK